MDGVIKSLHASEQNFTIDDEGEVDNFLGVKIQKKQGWYDYIDTTTTH